LPLRLKDKVAIITGSGRGIGKAIALRFSEEGAKVVVDDVNQETGNQTADLIQSEGHTAVFILADVTDPKMVEDMVAKTIRSFGKIDILVNNAICSTNDVLTNNWDANLNIILKGAQHCSQTIIPEMQKNGGGSIINIASVNGLIGLQGIHAYSASKGAIISLTKSLAISHGADNIRVNCICPGTIQTEVWEPMIERNPNILNDIIPHYPLHRIGQPIDIANAALFLASDESSFATGAIFTIDGGLTAGLHNFPI
tara:strand:+ start:2775 stop:3539 length:765 start_codon:yes stop_codon:yes gene_type:complete